MAATTTTTKNNIIDLLLFAVVVVVFCCCCCFVVIGSSGCCCLRLKTFFGMRLSVPKKKNHCFDGKFPINLVSKNDLVNPNAVRLVNIFLDEKGSCRAGKKLDPHQRNGEKDI